MSGLTHVTEEELLESVKNTLGITGTYQDNTLKSYIVEVQDYLLCAGVTQDVVNSKVAVGVIARGVSDLWNYGAGNTSLSLYFMQRVAQLSLHSRKAGD